MYIGVKGGVGARISFIRLSTACPLATASAAAASSTGRGPASCCRLPGASLLLNFRRRFTLQNMS
jgi:hypothetical protein